MAMALGSFFDRFHEKIIFQLCKNKNSPLKTNLVHENRPSQKKHSFPSRNFSGLSRFYGVYFPFSVANPCWPKADPLWSGKKTTSHFYFYLPCANSQIHRFSSIPFKHRKIQIASLQISCPGSPIGWFCYTSSNGGSFHWRAWNKVDSLNFDDCAYHQMNDKNHSATLRGESVATPGPEAINPNG